MKCEDCKYWENLHDLRGLCKRNAPFNHVLTSNEFYRPQAEWPETHPNSWCGEFIAKEKIKEPVPPPIEEYSEADVLP